MAPPPPPPPPLPSSGISAEDKDKWEKVKQRRKKNKTSQIAGKETGGVLEGVAPFTHTRNHWDISVIRVKDSLSSDQVRVHLQSKGIEVIDVWLLNSSIKGAKTAKVRVVREHKDRVKDANLWPVHCRISDWIYGSKDTKRPPVSNN